MSVIDSAPLDRADQRPATIVRLSGRIDIFTTLALRRRLIRALTHSAGPLTLDLSQVTSCSAGGLAVLVGLQRRARSQHVTLTLRGLSPFMVRLLTVSGLEHHFVITA